MLFESLSYWGRVLFIFVSHIIVIVDLIDSVVFASFSYFNFLKALITNARFHKLTMTYSYDNHAKKLHANCHNYPSGCIVFETDITLSAKNYYS